MRKTAAPILVGLGTFLLIAGVLALAWVPGAVKQTPLDIDTVTRLSGEAAKIDQAGQLVPRPIYAQSVTRVDSNASTDDLAVFAQWSCAAFGTSGDCVDRNDPNVVVVEEEELVTASDSIFAADRVTAEGVAAEELPKKAVDAGATTTEGLINKFPFDTEKKTYPYWDGTTGTAVDAVYDRTEKVEGVETYVFKTAVELAPLEIAEGVQGSYSSAKEIFVEPTTGAILNQTEDQQRWLRGGTPVLDLHLAFTDEQVEKSADEARSNKAKIDLLTKVVPPVGLIGGALLVALGVLLGRKAKRTEEDADSERSLATA